MLALGASLVSASDPTSIEETLLLQAPSDLLTNTHRAVCYSGFRSGQHPDRGEGAKNPSDAEILEDLRIVREQMDFRLIRLYDSRENSAAVLRLIREHDLDLKVLLGAWLDAEINNPACPWGGTYPAEKLEANRIENREEIARAIALAKRFPDTVIAVAVGNEALVEWNDHMVPLESMLRHVRRVKESVNQPVTVADNYDWWAKNGAPLAKEVDFLSVHIYPQWEERDIDVAMAYGIENLKAVRRAIPDKPIVITEAGWATTASEFGGRASEEKQARYVREMLDWSRRMNVTTFLFEAFDEDWKGDPGNPSGAEKHWGLYFIDRTPKQVMREPNPSTETPKQDP